MSELTEEDKEGITERITHEKTTLVVHHMVSVMNLILSDPSLLRLASDRIQLDINLFRGSDKPENIPTEVFLAQEFLDKMHHDYTRRMN